MAYDRGNVSVAIWYMSAFWIAGTLVMWIFVWKNAFDIKLDAENLSYNKISDTAWNEISLTDIQKAKFLVIGRYQSLIIRSRFKEATLSLNSTSDV